MGDGYFALEKTEWNIKKINTGTRKRYQFAGADGWGENETVESSLLRLDGRLGGYRLEL